MSSTVNVALLGMVRDSFARFDVGAEASHLGGDGLPVERPHGSRERQEFERGGQVYIGDNIHVAQGTGSLGFYLTSASPT